MNRSRNILKASIIIALLLITSVPFLTFTVAIVPLSNNSGSEGTEIIDTKTGGIGFYDNIGEIYDAKTDDNLIIKVFRYHAPGETFNDGAQPVLLFPGLSCNINQFLPYSTPTITKNYDILLPEDLAEWAIDDEKIEDDPMLYYSIAYYLWKKGYDPWFGNYRGVGYGEMRSEGGDPKTSMDQFALYDVKAAVKKVYEITGLHPVIGGHSTGGLVCMMYLHGTNFRWDGHIRSYDALVRERNGIIEGPETVAGFIGIDPAMIPILPDLMNNILIWSLLSTDLVLEAGDLIRTLADIDLVDSLLQGLLTLMVDEDILGETITDFLKNTANLDITNVNEELLYFFFTYAVDKMYFRTLSQYLDYFVYQCCREYWKNGWFNNLRLKPPKPTLRDGYYYYTKNMDKIQVPLICFLADSEGDLLDFVDADQIMKDLVNGKTINENDECYMVEAAHIDIGVGSRNPQSMFPKLGDWLAKI